MQEGNSNLNQQDSDSSLEHVIPQKNPSIQPQLTHRISGQCIRIEKKQEIIDEDAILNLYSKMYQKDDNQAELARNMPRKVSAKKVSKLSHGTSKSHGLQYVKKKYHQKIDQINKKFKEYIAQNRPEYDTKQKETLLQISKILIIGFFQLKNYSQLPGNNMTKNESKVISSETDVFEWIKILMEDFQTKFKEAQTSHKIPSAKLKWQALIKNCKDESNFQLRRKILRRKIQAGQVIQNKDDFLQSQEAKKSKQHQLKLILAEAQKERGPINQFEDNTSQEQIIENFQVPTKIPSSQNLSKKLSHEKEKVNEWIQCIGEECVQRLKNRIIEDLKDTISYQRIIKDFELKFPRT